MKLSTEQIAEFNTRGVIIAREALTYDDLQPVIDELSAWIDARARTLHDEGEIADLHEGRPVCQALRLAVQTVPRHRAWNGYHALSRAGDVRVFAQRKSAQPARIAA